MVAVRGGWVGMTIRLYPVTGALGVEAADDPEFCGKRNNDAACGQTVSITMTALIPGL